MNAVRILSENTRSYLAIALSFLAGAHCAYSVTYTPVDLGTLAGGSSEAIGVNNAGQVIGWANGDGNPNYSDHAFLYSGGVMTDLGALGNNFYSSRGLGLSDSGLVTGASYFSSNTNQHAFLYNGAMADLGALTTTSGPARDVSIGYDVNDSGQVVGYSYTATGGQHAIISSGGVMTDLGTLSGYESTAYSINNAGQAVGYFSYNKSGGGTGYSAFLYSGGTMTDLNGFSGVPDSNSRAFSINNAGLVTGWAYFPGNGSAHAFIYSTSTGAVTDLGSLFSANPGGAYSMGYSINNSGQVFGVSLAAGGAQHYFLSTNGVMMDLTNAIAAVPGISNIIIVNPENPQGNPSVSSALNDWGQIAAIGRVNGHDHALLLNPDTPVTTVTPGSQTSNVIGGMSYATVPALTNSSGRGTTAQLLGGAASGNRKVVMSFTGGGNFGGQASDTLSLSGTGASAFVLKLSYDEAIALALPGGELGLSLLWLDPADSAWKNAVLGNSNAGGMGLSGFRGDGAYDAATDFVLGYYGVNTIDNYVWAVLDHNSSFGAGIVGIPEPSALVECLGAAGLLFALLRRKCGGFR